MKSEFEDTEADVGLRGRIVDFTWANFTCTQSTGVVAIMLSETPHQFHGLQTIGAIIFIFNIVLFLCFCAVMLTRFIMHPHMLKKSVTTPPECFFIGSFWLSMATVIMCMQRFGVPHTGTWLVVAIRVLFWMYAAITLIYATAMFATLYLKPILTPSQIQPAVFISVYNTMLTGIIAASIASSQPPAARLPIIVAGVAYQGLGWILSLVLMPWFVGNTIGNGPGGPSNRPNLFLAVGSSGYTIVSLVGCAKSLPTSYDYFARHPNGVEILQVMADWIGVFLWLFTFWLFATALLVNLPTVFPRIGAGFRPSPRMSFELGWWSMIFPNVGFTLATGYIGRQFQSNAIQWIATIMTVILFVFWLMNLALHAKAAALAVMTLNKAR
ncbi:voltage-dependent anion channel [Xylaria bambusicola]|uniref:voltage-dependent anion channel n=1 Tax=Xylaria bambusicola TaxID=326684 RepID=UPI002008BA7F|nr:voltage-dependent anion channel [Xylaria bambusicola]KAI0526020.1 voltage-dependent anion channel [Xylaria bambusicola]